MAYVERVAELIRFEDGKNALFVYQKKPILKFFSGTLSSEKFSFNTSMVPKINTNVQK